MIPARMLGKRLPRALCSLTAGARTLFTDATLYASPTALSRAAEYPANRARHSSKQAPRAIARPPPVGFAAIPDMLTAIRMRKMVVKPTYPRLTIAEPAARIARQSVLVV